MRLCLVSFALFLAPAHLDAQVDSSSPGALVRTSAQATRDLEAASAALLVNFSVGRRTPGDAGRANAERALALRQALRALGIPNDSITTSGYSSTMHVDPSRRDTSFVASNAVVVRIGDLRLVGPAIDTVLAEGATHVGGVQFRARGVERARLDALAEATRVAREQANAMARAAGGRLGRLVQVSTEAPVSNGYLGLDALSLTASGGTPIQAPNLRLAVTVYATWLFVPDRQE